MTTRRFVLPSAATVPAVAALVCIVFGVLPLAKVAAPGIMQWYRHIAMYWLVVGGALLGVLLLAGRLLPSRMDAAAEVLRRRVLAVPQPVFLGVVALFVLVTSAVIAWFCFGRQPHNADEVAQLWHARILLSGRLALPADPNPEFFAIDNVIDRGLWYSQFPVGGPALLAVGMGLGAAWLVNPVLLALTVFSLHGFARRTHGAATARATTLLFALSPMVLFMGASFMNHVPILWLVTVALASLAQWHNEADALRRRWWSLAIGVSLGVAFTVRPLDAVVVAGVIGAAQLLMLRENPGRWRTIPWQLASGLLPVAALMIVQSRTTGAPLRFGYDVLYGSAHKLGFHLDPYGTAHTPTRAIAFAGLYLVELSVKLFEWPLPALGVLAAGLLAMRRPTRWDFLLLGLCGATVIAYALYWHQGSFRGPRFLFPALPGFLVLLARTPAAIAARVSGAPRRAVRLLLPSCLLIAWGASSFGDSFVGRARMYADTALSSAPDPGTLARDAGLRHALVFVRQLWSQRLLRRLWALGVDRGPATRLLASAHPCAVQIALEQEESRTPADTVGRTDRLVRAALAPIARDDALRRCDAEEAGDRDGGTSYGPYLAANQIDDEGRVSGNVIYVLDLGAHDETLRARFGDREWYVLGRHLTRGDARPTLVPYDSVSGAAPPTALPLRR